MSYEQEFNEKIEIVKKRGQLHDKTLDDLYAMKAGAMLADDHGLKIRHFESPNPYGFAQGWGFFANAQCGTKMDGYMVRDEVFAKIATYLEPDFQMGFLVHKNSPDNDRHGLWMEGAPNNFMELEAIRIKGDALFVYSPDHGRIGMLPIGLVISVRDGAAMNLEERMKQDRSQQKQPFLAL